MKMCVRFIVMSAVIFSMCSASLADRSRNIEYILDASNSMNEALPDGHTKIDAAKQVLCSLIDNIAAESSSANIGLRIYGANFNPAQTKETACMDSVLAVPIQGINASALKGKINSVTAAGYTPIAYSLELAGKDFPNKKDSNIIVLVSDGKETCGGDPAGAARKLIEQGFDLKIYTIGFAVDAETRKQLEEIAGVTGGKYFDAKDAAGLEKSLEEVKQRSFEEYESAGKKVEPSLWINSAPEVAAGDYKGTIAMYEVKFYKVKAYKGQTVKAALIVKKTPYNAPQIHQSFYVKMFDRYLSETAEAKQQVDGNPDTVVTFKAKWEADKTGWVYIAVAASKNYGSGLGGTGITPVALSSENSMPKPSQYTLKVKIKGKAGKEEGPGAFTEYPAEDIAGGSGFEKAENITIDKAINGNIYMKETRFYKLSVPEAANNSLRVVSVLQKPWYAVYTPDGWTFENNMTFILKAYDEDWVEIAKKELTISGNTPVPFSAELFVDPADNDEIYLSLSASKNHVSGNIGAEVPLDPKGFKPDASRYTILVTNSAKTK